MKQKKTGRPAPSKDLRAALAVRDEVLLGSQKPWMRTVLYSAVGMKFREGRSTGKAAIQLVVRDKVDRESLSKELRIPRSIRGIPTDVMSASDGLGGASVGAPTSDVEGAGFGVPLICGAEQGTASCLAVTSSGKRVLLTSRHVVDPGQDVRLRTDERPIVGRMDKGCETADAARLYPNGSGAPAGTHRVGLAAIALEPDVASTPGLPGGATLSARQLGNFGALLGTKVIAWGATTRCWRQGEITGLWPRRQADGVLSLCKIHQSPASDGGDSGGLWLAEDGKGRYLAIGVHQGLDSDGDAAFAIATDVAAGLRVLELVRVE
jgi:hypothetical protein